MVAPPSAFRAGLAGLSTERFRRFVRDLWEARGRTVERDGDVLVVRRGPDRSPLRAICVTDELPATDAVDTDVIVTSQDPGDGAPASAITISGPTALYRQVSYAVDADDRDRLLRTYVDPALADRVASASAAYDGESRRTGETGSDPPRCEATATDPDEADAAWRPSRRAVIAAGGMFLAGVGTTWAIGGDDEAAGRTEDATPPAAPVAGVADRGNESSSRPPATTAPRPGGVGITGGRVSPAGTLVSTHLDRLSETGSVITARKTVVDDADRITAALDIGVAHSPEHSFLARVSTQGPEGPTIVGEPPVDAAYWSDSERYLRRRSTADGTDYGAYEPTNELAEWYYWTQVVPFGGPPHTAVTFYRTLFGLVPTRAERASETADDATTIVAEGERLRTAPRIFRVVDDDQPISDLDLRASIDAEGIIRSLELSYAGRVDGASRAVTWTIEYERVGTVVVGPPPWYRRSLYSLPTRT